MQMWCISRMLPLPIGDRIPIGNAYYEFLLLLLRCMEIIFAPSVHVSLVVYLRHLIVQHHTIFQNLFPDIRMINKHHHIVHYPTCILKFGPLSNVSCFKYEMKHIYSKRVGHVVCNFKNICQTVTKKHQLYHCTMWSSVNVLTAHKMECNSGEVLR